MCEFLSLLGSVNRVLPLARTPTHIRLEFGILHVDSFLGLCRIATRYKYKYKYTYSNIFYNMPQSTRKRGAAAAAMAEKEEAVQEEVSEDEEMSDADDSDEEMEDNEDNEEPTIGSPSPNAKKDMRLRSGKRKRRRSKETSGLTPDDTKTQPDRSTTGRRKRTKLAVENYDENDNDNDNEGNAKKADDELPPRPARGKKARVSFLATDHAAVAAAQDQPVRSTGSASSADAVGGDSNRRLFENRPPSSLPVAARPVNSDKDKDIDDEAVAAPPPVVLAPETMAQAEPSSGQDDAQLPPSSRCLLLWRIAFMLGLGLAVAVSRPITVAVTDWILPLKEMELPELPKAPPTSIQGQQDAPKALGQTVSSLGRLQDRAQKKLDMVQKSYQEIQDNLQNMEATLTQGTKLLERSAHLNQAEELLLGALDDADLNSPKWKEARQGLSLVERSLLNMADIGLWKIDQIPEGCTHAIGTQPAVVDNDDNPHIKGVDLDALKVDLLKQIQSGADEVMASPEETKKVRAWIQEQIQHAVQANPEASKAIANLAHVSKEGPPKTAATVGGGLGLGEIEEIVEERLEKERADRTGEYDHASVYNGAQVIYGGKRGTSKSLVDSLPVVNRLLQLAQLRFYGFGPEAAITPTYPYDALGQCWSFQQADLKEQLKQQRSLSSRAGDDHKRGNYGTLTIKLPTSVSVHTVVIEHPPGGVTNQVNSAIRAFRIIGYEDADANSKSWSLGSFEYDISKFWKGQTTNPVSLPVVSPTMFFFFREYDGASSI